jgi:phosphatidylglycerophosphatase A
LIAALLQHYVGFHQKALLVWTAAFTPLGIWAAGAYARSTGSKDPGAVVIDEVLGQWLALALAPALSWPQYAGAFLLFRLFDIWKPAPIRYFETWPGGAGIVADDLMAGFYAALVLKVISWVYLV